MVTMELLDGIASALRADEYLLICASSFDPDCKKRHGNVIIQKIPLVLLVVANTTKLTPTSTWSKSLPISGGMRVNV
jgi:hypothetical protein